MLLAPSRWLACGCGRTISSYGPASEVTEAPAGSGAFWRAATVRAPTRSCHASAAHRLAVQASARELGAAERSGEADHVVEPVRHARPELHRPHREGAALAVTHHRDAPPGQPRGEQDPPPHPHRRLGEAAQAVVGECEGARGEAVGLQGALVAPGVRLVRAGPRAGDEQYDAVRAVQHVPAGTRQPAGGRGRRRTRGAADEQPGGHQDGQDEGRQARPARTLHAPVNDGARGRLRDERRADLAQNKNVF